MILDYQNKCVLTLTKEMSDFFEGAIDHGADVKLTSNWLMGGVNEYLNKNQVELKDANTRKFSWYD